jgi:CTP:molybdopterin cytidylyltransferase MocA
MRAVILAAGKGERLNGKVKALLEVGGSTIIDRLIGQLWRTEAPPVVVVGYHADEIMWHLGSSPLYVYNSQYAKTGSAESLRLALEALHDERDIVVAYADTVFDSLTVASVINSPSTAALIPYDGVSYPIHTYGDHIVGSPKMRCWSWAGIARLEAPSIDFDREKDSAAVFLPNNLSVIHGRSVNVNTPSDLEDARRFCA